MNRKLIRQLDVLSGDQFNAQPGRIHGIWLLFEGTNDTGQTGALSDLGSVVFTRGQRQIDNVDMDGMGEIDDIRFGGVLFSSTTAGAFLAAVFVPFFEGAIDDLAYQNALAIAGEDELNIEWNPASSADTVFTNITCKVYQQLASYPERYEYRILRDNPNVDAALAGKPFYPNRDNISNLFLSDPDDVLTNVQIEQNGKNIYSPQPWEILLAGTLMFNNLEVSTFDWVQLKCYSPGVPASSRNKDTILYLTTSGSGNVRNIITQLHWWDKKNR